VTVVPADTTKTPAGPTTPRRSAGAWATLKTTARKTWADGGTNLAAALTFYTVLSVFPALLVFVALVALLGQPSTVRTVLQIVGKLGPPSAVHTFSGPITAALRHGSAAGLSLGIGLVSMLWASSAYVGTFLWVAGHIWPDQRQRSFARRLCLRVLTTLAVIVLVALVFAGLVVSGPLVRDVGDGLGLSRGAQLAYEILRWLVFLAVGLLVFELLYFIGLAAQHTRYRALSLGGLVGVAIWLAASVGLAFYVAHFGSYDRLYGSLAGVVVFLMWAWLFNLGLIFGTELDAELLRQRAAKEEGDSEQSGTR
jgi:membrane protein